MYVATNRIRIQAKSGGKLEKRFKERQGVQNQPGFLSLELWKTDDSEGRPYEEYLVVTHWESKSDFQAWTSSVMIERAQSEPQADKVIERQEFTGYNVRQSSRMFRLFGKDIGLDVT